MLESNWQESINNHKALSALAALGLLYTWKKISGLASFTYTHFLRSTSIRRYNHTSDGRPGSSWAIVTGASDGIGKGFAEELCLHGFNVVLHGRNETKLKALQQEFKKQWPDRETKILVLDAGKEASNETKLHSAAEELEDLNLRVLINHVGGSAGLRPMYVPLHETTADRTTLFMDLNARFPTEITRVLLPILINNSPSLILNMGSLAAEVPSPYVSVYSGTKAYNKSWARSLGYELKAEGHDIEVKLIETGQVSTANEPRETNLVIPDARTFAKHALAKVGDGKREVYGYWPQEVQHRVLDLLPAWVLERTVLRILKGLKEKEEREAKDQ